MVNNGTSKYSNNGNGNGNGNGDGIEDRIGAGGEERKKRKKPHESCRRDVGNGGAYREKQRRQERVGSVASDPDNLENSRKAGGEAQGT